jgi:hypothetical protein
MASVVANGNTYTDDSSPTTGLANGGYITRFIPCLSDTLVELGLSVTAAGAAFTAASATSATIGTGSQSLAIGTGKGFVAGMVVIAWNTGTPANFMAGTVTSYTAGTLAFTVAAGDTGGSGTLAAWTVSLGGRKGATGTTGTAATVAVGAVTTGAPGSSVIVTNSGTSAAAVFDITIPRGNVGATGAGSTVFTAVNGVSTGTARPTNNFISNASDGVRVAAVDNAGSTRTDITVTANFLAPKNHYLATRNG